jgi:Electron transfer DM13
MKTMYGKMQVSDNSGAMELSKMMIAVKTRRNVIIASIVVVSGICWYLFRPELLFVNKTVNESLPMASDNMSAAREPMTLVTGMFHKGAHETKGTATVHQLPDGKRILRLTGFETSNGPDVHVYLVAANDAMDNDTVKSAGFVDLGSLKGNMGEQNYDIPADVDLAKHRAVTIWCARFGVNFGTAPLN